jgi:hypothetical protein
MSALPPKADIPCSERNARLVPGADISNRKINSVPASTSDFRILVQYHIQQRTMDFYAAVVVDKA